MLMMEIIKFYQTNEEYGCFSNFADYPIELKGKSWPTSEHYFQAQKFVGTKHEEEIRKINSPMMAAQLGRDRKKPLRRDWEKVKDSICEMRCWQNFGNMRICKKYCWLLVMPRLSNIQKTIATGAMVAMAKGKIN